MRIFLVASGVIVLAGCALYILWHPEPEDVRRNQLLESSVQSGVLKPDRTSTAEVQLMEGLRQQQLSGVNLHSVECWERFCQAEFFHQSGHPPDTTALVSIPPFEWQRGQPSVLFVSS